MPVRSRTSISRMTRMVRMTQMKENSFYEEIGIQKKNEHIADVADVGRAARQDYTDKKKLFLKR